MTTLAIFGYAGFVGGDVPIARAALMAAAVLVGRALEVDADAGNLLGLAAILLLAHQPSSAADVGFQLSFGATLGILALIAPLTRNVPRLPLRLDLALAASVAAQCALAPLIAMHFHRIAPAAILLNVAAVPLSGAVLLAGFAVLALAPTGAGGRRRRSRLAGRACPARVGRPGARRRLAGRARAGPLAGRARPPRRGPRPRAARPAVPRPGGDRRGSRRARLGAARAPSRWPPAPDGDRRGPGRRPAAPLALGSRHRRRRRADPGTRASTRARGAWRPCSGARACAGSTPLVVSHAHPDHAGGVPFLLRAFRVESSWEGPARAP